MMFKWHKLSNFATVYPQVTYRVHTNVDITDAVPQMHSRLFPRLATRADS
jgi:hypothetical protein